jgi:signal transduction histidine kinase/CheY-like chemotaxis protein
MDMPGPSPTKRRRFGRHLIDGFLAGGAVLTIASLGLLFMWHAAREAQLDAVRSELRQLAREAAQLVDGDLHRSLTSQTQAGSPEHLKLLAPLVKFHKAAANIIYVYTAILDRGRVYYILGTDYLYRVPGDEAPPDPIMAPHDTFDPTLRRALERHEVSVNEEPVQEKLRSYMSAYAPFFDGAGRFVGVVGVDMWVRDFDARMASIRRAGLGAFLAVSALSLVTGVVVMRLSRTAERSRLRDRAKRARLADAKKRADDRAVTAQATAKAKGELLAVMSHEIRTPMSGVLGFTNLLLDTPLSHEQREFALTVQRSGTALLEVLNDVLDYSKIEAGRMTIERISVPLEELCEGVRSILSSAALERGVTIEVDYDARLPKYVKGDPMRIRQVLLNLAGNAVKFTDGGSVVIAAACHEAGRFMLSVADTGVGIPPEQLPSLFTQYSQGDASTARRFGGTGLGLAISKTLVELMGGEIGVESNLGSGSTFWLVLPLEAAEAAGVPSADAPVTSRHQTPGVSGPGPALSIVQPRASVSPIRRAPRSEAGAARESVAASAGRDVAAPAAESEGGAVRAAPSPDQTRLLLVEDNFVNQRVATYMLAKLGYRVEVAQNGREAVERLRQASYDLVLMDCQMPEMDGFEATRIIRDAASDVKDHAVPIIAMTANAFPEDRTRSLACGMNDFLSKPVEQATLSEMITKWLRPVEETKAG